MLEVTDSDWNKAVVAWDMTVKNVQNKQGLSMHIDTIHNIIFNKKEAISQDIMSIDYDSKLNHMTSAEMSDIMNEIDTENVPTNINDNKTNANIKMSLKLSKTQKEFLDESVKY